MYENEFNSALQAIAESVDNDDFDSIIESSAALIEEYNLPMDEAVGTSAAILFNEDAIDATSYSVTSAVMDEFANNRPISWDEALSVISESVDDETFDLLMTEAVNDIIGIIDEETDSYSYDQSGVGRPKPKKTIKERLTGVKTSIKNAPGNAKQGIKKYGAAKKQAIKDFAGTTKGKVALTGTGLGVAGLGAKAIYDKAKHGDALYTAKKIKAAANEKLNAAANTKAGQKAIEMANTAKSAAKAAGQVAAKDVKEFPEKYRNQREQNRPVEREQDNLGESALTLGALRCMLESAE